MKQKNILLIFCDQLRADMTAARGNGIVKTPVMDSLAGRGVTFENAYTPSPVCVAARHCLHSGLATYESGCTDNMPMPAAESFMEILSQNGYQTHGVGKMHFTFPDTFRWGFEGLELSEEVNGAPTDAFRAMLYENGYSHVKDLHGVRSEMYYIPQVSQLPAHLHNTAWVAQRSVEFLENRDKSRPFFLMASYIKPHPPFENPVPWNKLYRCSEMPDPYIPENRDDLICYVNKYQNAYKYRSQGYDRNLIRTMRAAYYGCVSFIDYTLKNIISYLDQNDLTKDTLVLLTADHGEMLGDYNCYGKRCFLESSANIPLIVCDPSQGEKGVAVSTPVSLYDIFPTILSYARISYDPARYVGENLADIVRNGGDRTVYGQFSHGNTGLYMAKNTRYKYIYSAADDKEWLFDAEYEKSLPNKNCFNKKSESVNFASEKPDITADMRNSLLAHFTQRHTPSPFAKKYPTLDVNPLDDTLLLRQDPQASLHNFSW